MKKCSESEIVLQDKIKTAKKKENIEKDLQVHENTKKTIEKNGKCDEAISYG